MASKPNMDATANITATPGAPCSAADAEKLSAAPRPSGPPPLHRVTMPYTSRMPNSASTNTARMRAPISMPAAPRAWTTAMVASAYTHQASSTPVWSATRPATIEPYRPYMPAWMTQYANRATLALPAPAVRPRPVPMYV
ncbi:hypothetical protein GCM10020256_12330 [Streptomyces thermocoprophilus]